MSDGIEESRPLRDALADFLLAVKALENSAVALADEVGDDDVPGLDGDQLEAAWKLIRSRHEEVEAKFAELAESTEDAADLADALAADREGGEPVTWKELKAELGLE